MKQPSTHQDPMKPAWNSLRARVAELEVEVAALKAQRASGSRPATLTIPISPDAAWGKLAAARPIPTRDHPRCLERQNEREKLEMNEAKGISWRPRSEPGRETAWESACDKFSKNLPL